MNTTYWIYDDSIKNGKTIIAEIEVMIKPKRDDAFPEGAMDDVFILEWETGDWILPSDELRKLIQEQIKQERPKEWREIREMAE